MVRSVQEAKGRGGGKLATAGRAGEMPGLVRPMLAVLGELPEEGRGGEWRYEFKWDGVRGVFYAGGGAVAGGRGAKLLSRNDRDMLGSYPELRGLVEAFGGGKGRLGGGGAILDGELVALDERGRPDFPLLQHRMHVRKPSAGLVARVPVHYMVFDVLYWEGRVLMEEPYDVRREVLEGLELPAPVLVPPRAMGGGEQVLEAAREMGLEGVVAKRGGSAYEAGRRSGSWVKVKLVRRQEFVVGGWVPEKGGRGGKRVGSLLLGVFGEERGGGGLRYVGSVGTGFSDAEHARLLGALLPLERGSSAFAAGEELPREGVRFVLPRLVAEVEYRRWPEGGRLHQTSFKGLRLDKDAGRITQERLRA